MFKTMTKCLNAPKNKLPNTEEISKIPAFVFGRWLSGNQYAIQAANQLNLYHHIPIENQFRVINSAFGGKIKYIPYPKSIKEDTSKTLDMITQHFKINPNMAQEYLDLIDPEELDGLKKMYQFT